MTYEYFPVLTLSPRVNQRDGVCGKKPGAGTKPPPPAMLRAVCDKVKP